jgi:hypothetical protein
VSEATTRRHSTHLTAHDTLSEALSFVERWSEVGAGRHAVAVTDRYTNGYGVPKFVTVAV